jgi:hypothetical protein
LIQVDASATSDVWAIGRYWTPPASTTPPVPFVERWNGRRWALVVGPDDKQNAHYEDIRVFGRNDAWIVGTDEHAHPLAAHWDGTRWSVSKVPNPTPNPRNEPLVISAIAGHSSRDLWAVGTIAEDVGALTMHWDGRMWKEYPNPLHGQGVNTLQDVAVPRKGGAWAVGYRPTGNAVLRWSGSPWALVPSTVGREPLLTGIAASSDRDIWIVGQLNGTGSGFTAHWNGRSWSNTVVPVGVLNDVSVAANRSVWAAGDTASQEVFIAHRVGTRWDGQILPTRPQATLTGVIAVAPSDVWAVGSTDFTDRSLIVHYSC